MRVKYRATTALVVGGLVATAALTGCSGGGSSASDTSSQTLTVWVDPNRAEELKDIVAQFEADKGINVKLVQKEYGDTMKEDFIKQAPTGKGPDVIVGGSDWLGLFVQNGVVAPLELGDTADEYSDVAIRAMSYEGTTYGLPVSVENIALVRNTALADSTPATWDELIAAGQAVVTSGAAQYPVLVPSGPESDPYHLYPLQTSYGAPLFGTNPDGSYNPNDLLIGSPGGEEFAQKLVEWGQEGVLNTNITNEIARDEFAAGKSPYMLSGPWNLPAFKDGGIEYTIDPIPQAGPEAPTPFVGVQGFFVSAKSENALAANEFVVNYLGTEEVQLALYKAGGRPPAMTSAFEIASAENPDVGAYGEVALTGVPMPAIPEMGAVWNYWGATEAALVNNTAGDPATAWQTMADRIAADIAK
ncbi:arabinogalactan oligomer/maltooligosaccharide transport system substrate-binding protein [Microbacterium trichothecenolyticum]|uniref:sugar ABC transporter substrate-binding protein n=1 Tax=Microbacterium trichothecenolyticum TaxID=69370 RepID=UPI002866A519|nr:maltose ABC transporter substrate-binding protein [Microbacterium trichothecenolyticum]MDR7183443.1 arabinogalactan oligomer/maltooligosaccharide transport system substrate-binding protein [Microbacterium trichothecenolyticum]